MKLAELGIGVDCMSLTPVKRSHSVCAQGGINSVNDVTRQQGDNEWKHFDDSVYGGDFLQHLLIGVPAQRRLSLLYIPTPLATAERRAQTQQVSTESEQTLRARWGFGTSARQRRAWHDAAQREEDLVEGRTVFKVVWLITVTAPTPGELEASIGQVEAAARRCSLELRLLAGSQRQGHAFTLPLCRGAR
jgi:hypothetical protein